MFASSKAQAPPPLSEEEKDSRRAAAAKAAQDRGSAWDKRLAGTSKSKKGAMSAEGDGRPVYDHDSGPTSAETQRVAAAAKRREEEVARSMGYNPYQPLMSFSGAAAAAAVGAPGSGTGSTPRSGSGGGTTPTPRRLDEGTAASTAAAAASGGGGGGGAGFEIDEPELENSINEALGLLMSTAEADGPRVQTAITTAGKMLRSLSENRGEPKLRKIRLANPNFSSRVVEVPGGLQLFLAAGFVVVSEEPEGGGEAESFLVHSMEPHAGLQLDYTLARLADLI